MTELQRLLDLQRGLLTRAQLLAAGVPADRVDERVRTRVWAPVLPRTYLVRPGLAGAELRVRAAVLWAGADAVLTGLGAAWWLGLVPAAPATVHVTDPRRARAVRRPGIVVRPGRQGEVAEVRGLRVTAVAVTVVDAAVELGGVAGLELLARLGGGVGTVRPRSAGAAWLLRDLRHEQLARRRVDGRVCP